MTRLAFPLIFLLPLLASGQDKLVPIFDGKTLNGWEQKNGSAKYEVSDGMIVGTTVEGSPNSFLCTTKEYGDFVLEFEVKVAPELNSGVQLRSHQYQSDTEVVTFNRNRTPRKQPAGRVHGYQVEIANEQAGTSGGIYDEARRGWLHNIQENPASRAAFKDGEWNRYRIEAEGDSIKTSVNGVACAAIRDSLDLSGFIALQVHSFKGEKPAQVRWRNIRIADKGRHEWKPLSDGKTLAGWSKWGGGEWKVEDGVFRGAQKADSQERGFLLSDESFADATVRLQYQTLKGNSGFFFRMRDPQTGSGRLGYEVEVDPGRDAGGLQEVGGRGWLVRRGPLSETFYYLPEQWNTLTVSAHGKRIAVHVNGEKTADLADDPGPEKGRLGLQLNPKQDLDVMFRKIEILRPAKAR